QRAARDRFTVFFGDPRPVRIARECVVEPCGPDRDLGRHRLLVPVADFPPHPGAVLGEERRVLRRRTPDRIAHRPVKFGARLPANAATPSAKSALAPAMLWRCASYASAA